MMKRKISGTADQSCPVCNLVLSTKQSRNRHIARAHKDFDLAAYEKNSVRQRITSAEMLVRPAFFNRFFPVCDYCGSFFDYGNVGHSQVHRPFVCKLCSAAFSTQIALNYHHKREHAVPEACKFACQKCGKRLVLFRVFRDAESPGCLE